MRPRSEHSQGGGGDFKLLPIASTNTIRRMFAEYDLLAAVFSQLCATWWPSPPPDLPILFSSASRNDQSRTHPAHSGTAPRTR